MGAHSRGAGAVTSRRDFTAALALIATAGPAAAQVGLASAEEDKIRRDILDLREKIRALEHRMMDMIRNGSVKLNVDITSFLLEDNNSIF